MSLLLHPRQKEGQESSRDDIKNVLINQQIIRGGAEEQHSLRKQGRLRAGSVTHFFSKVTCPNARKHRPREKDRSFRVLLYYITAIQEDYPA